MHVIERNDTKNVIQICVLVHPILTQTKYNQIPCTYMSTMFPLNIAVFWWCGIFCYSCYQSNHEWLKTY